MPYRAGPGGPFTGDDDMADFIDDVWRPFATDAKGSGGLGWIEQAAARGTHPNYEFLFSRGGVGTEAPPFVFFQTTAKTLFIFSGDGVDTGEEPYDQPGNPMNEPIDASFSDPAGEEMGTLGCLALTTVVGPYDNYWLFGGPTGEYLHCVLKVSSREYRHFHVGMLSPLDSDLHADSFYVTNHRWSHLGADDLYSGASATNSDNIEHQPYNVQHHLPFRNNDNTNITFGGDCRSTGLWIYSPGYGSEALDWWFPIGKRRSTSGGSGNPAETIGRVRNSSGNFNGAVAVTKTVGDVNATDDAVAFGAAFVSGYDKAIGTVPFCCEPTFTTDGIALIPIFVGLPSDFESELRWGPVAQIPDVYRVNMKNLAAEQEIVLGSDTYTVFPLMNKDSANTLDNEGYSGYEGLAYKKITANAT